MIKNSTLWDHLLNGNYKSFDLAFHSLCRKDKDSQPRKETVRNILSYARSVKSIKTNSGERLLYNLN